LFTFALNHKIATTLNYTAYAAHSKQLFNTQQDNHLQLTVIGHIHTPFKEKFGIPRQPGLAPAAKGIVKMLPGFNDINSFRGIDAFSHLWLVFQFHQIEAGKWRPLVRPPRLGGNEKLGVFATRSTHRPSNLGLSVVQFEKVAVNQGQVELTVSGVDLLDGTPIIDIKPYIEYTDSIPQAQSGFASDAPSRLPVEFSPNAQSQLQPILQQLPHFQALIEQTLCYQAAPAYHQQEQSGSQPTNRQPLREYGVLLYQYNVVWTQSQQIIIKRIELAK